MDSTCTEFEYYHIQRNSMSKWSLSPKGVSTGRQATVAGLCGPMICFNLSSQLLSWQSCRTGCIQSRTAVKASQRLRRTPLTMNDAVSSGCSDTKSTLDLTVELQHVADDHQEVLVLVPTNLLSVLAIRTGSGRREIRSLQHINGHSLSTHQWLP